MKQKQISESQLDEVVKIIVGQQGIINLDAEDVRYVLSGKSGFLYSAQQEDEDYQEFMKRTFQELSKQPFIQKCQHMLLDIGYSPEEPITMEDMDIIHDFMGSIMNDVMDMKWGLKKNGGGDRMTIHVICTNDIQDT